MLMFSLKKNQNWAGNWVSQNYCLGYGQLTDSPVRMPVGECLELYQWPFTTRKPPKSQLDMTTRGHCLLFPQGQGD